MTGIIGGVGINKVKEIFLPIPPIPEQIRIICLLSSLLSSVDSLETDEQILDALERSFG